MMSSIKFNNIYANTKSQVPRQIDQTLLLLPSHLPRQRRLRRSLPGLRRRKKSTLRLQNHQPTKNNQRKQRRNTHQKDQRRNRQHATRQTLLSHRVLPGQTVTLPTRRSTNNIYIICEYCNGGSLANHIQNREYLTQWEAVKFFKVNIIATRKYSKDSTTYAKATSSIATSNQPTSSSTITQSKSETSASRKPPKTISKCSNQSSALPSTCLLRSSNAKSTPKKPISGPSE